MRLGALTWVLGALAVLAAPTAAAASPPPDAPSVGVVGDSVLLQAVRDVDRVLSRHREIVFGDAGLGFKLRDVMASSREAVTGPNPPSIIVAVIGTAQSHTDPPDRWRRELRRWLDLISPRVDCIRFFDITTERTGFYAHHDRYAEAYDRITHQVVPEYPNAEWFHYNAWAQRAGLEFERPDHLHHNAAGQAQVAALMGAAADSCDPAYTTGPFWDVPDSYWAADEIAWLHDQGLATGFANRTYRAEIGTFVLSSTRGQLTQMLWREQGSPSAAGPSPWSDSRPWVEPALAWASESGVGRGYSDGTYRPNDAIRRGQAVATLWRAAGSPQGNPPHPWVDGSARLDAALRWAAATGVMNGYPDGRFHPGRPVTRAQVARLLFRYDALP